MKVEVELMLIEGEGEEGGEGWRGWRERKRWGE